VESEEGMYKAIVRLWVNSQFLLHGHYENTGQPLDYGDGSLGYVDNILKMMFKKSNAEYVVDPKVSSSSEWGY
jgi:citrate synthase